LRHITIVIEANPTNVVTEVRHEVAETTRIPIVRAYEPESAGSPPANVMLEIMAARSKKSRVDRRNSLRKRLRLLP
jgi:hypothetical protein